MVLQSSYHAVMPCSCTNLSLTAGNYATDIPAFNPMRLFAEDVQEKVDQIPEITDADVSVLRRDLASLVVEASAPSLSDNDVLAILDEERRVASETGRRASVAIPAQQMLSRTLRQPDVLGDALGYARVMDAPFSTIEVRMVRRAISTIVMTVPSIISSMLAAIHKRSAFDDNHSHLEAVRPYRHHIANAVDSERHRSIRSVQKRL